MAVSTVLVGLVAPLVVAAAVVVVVLLATVLVVLAPGARCASGPGDGRRGPINSI